MDHSSLSSLNSHSEAPTGLLDKAEAILTRLRSETASTGGDSGTLAAVADLPERSAILEFDAGLPRAEAEEAAAREFGFKSLSEAHAASVARWRVEIERLPALRTADGVRLRRCALAFLDRPWLGQALRLGWGELELWGVHELAPFVRGDAMGLVASLALSPLGWKLAELTPHAAITVTQSGWRLTRSRFPAGIGAAVPLWECQVLVRRFAA